MGGGGHVFSLRGVGYSRKRFTPSQSKQTQRLLQLEILFLGRGEILGICLGSFFGGF